MKIERIKNKENLIFPNRQFEPNQFSFRLNLILHPIDSREQGKRQKGKNEKKKKLLSERESILRCACV